MSIILRLKAFSNQSRPNLSILAQESFLSLWLLISRLLMLD